MPINNNVQCLNAYDAGGNIPVEHLGAIANPLCQQVAHCLAFEVLRGWRQFTVAEYNAMGEPEPYQSTRAAIIAAALERVKLNPASSDHASMLTPGDIEVCAIQGENYFEHGYATIIGSVVQASKRTFSRTDVVVQ